MLQEAIEHERARGSDANLIAVSNAKLVADAATEEPSLPAAASACASPASPRIEPVCFDVHPPTPVPLTHPLPAPSQSAGSHTLFARLLLTPVEFRRHTVQPAANFFLVTARPLAVDVIDCVGVERSVLFSDAQLVAARRYTAMLCEVLYSSTASAQELEAALKNSATADAASDAVLPSGCRQYLLLPATSVSASAELASELDWTVVCDVT